jgi:hypothetical protein
VQRRTRAARLALIRATEEALDRYPEHTMRVLRTRLERAASRAEGEPLSRRTVGASLMVRAIDVHPATGERLVRLWLKRAADRQRAAGSGTGLVREEEEASQSRLTWSRSIRRSARAITWRARVAASGLTEIDVIPRRTRNSANSGRFDGA